MSAGEENMLELELEIMLLSGEACCFALSKETKTKLVNQFNKKYKTEMLLSLFIVL